MVWCFSTNVWALFVSPVSSVVTVEAQNFYVGFGNIYRSRASISNGTSVKKINKTRHNHSFREPNSRTACSGLCWRHWYEPMLLAVGFLALMIFSDVSLSCIDREQSTAENAREMLGTADLAFRGTVVSSLQTDDGVQRVLFKIDTTFKGPPAQELYVLNQLLFSCAKHMESSGEYYIFGKFTDVSNEVYPVGFVSVDKANEYGMELGFNS